MMEIYAAARPSRRRIVYLAAALAGVVAGLAIGLAVRAVPSRIPADARVVTVAPVFNFGSGPSSGTPDTTFTITDPAQVAQIVAFINGLRQLSPGPYSCPSEIYDPVLLTSMQLTFRAVPGGPVVATAGAGYVGCQMAWVTAGTQTTGPLAEQISLSGPTLQQQVLAIAGISWPYPPGSALGGLRSAQLVEACAKVPTFTG
jgi:hypothetical protein